MNPHPPAPAADVGTEISGLIAILHDTGQRLEQLTQGEVDTVADSQGRTFLLRRAQNDLRDRDASRQAAILNALPAFVALIDLHGVIVSVNQAWRQFKDADVLHAPGHGLGMNYLGICDGASGKHAAESHRVADGIRAVMGGTVASFSIEYPCHSPLQRRWFVLTVTPLAENLPNGVVVMHVDITAERQAEESLRVSESRFRQLAENIRDVFFLEDSGTGRMLYVSHAYEEVWGRSCESLYAHPHSWTDSIDPDDRDTIHRDYRTAASDGTFELEFRIVRPDGAVRWIESRGFPILDDAGKLVRIARIAKDITEHKRDSQQLHESERRFSVMLDNVELASVMLDRQARITYCNEYLLRLTGWRLDEVIGRNWFETFVPAQGGAAMPDFEKLLANSPEAWHREDAILTRSGDLRLMRWNNSVLRSGTGEVIGSACIGEDITERKAAEEVLAQRAAELERFHRLSVGRELQMVELKKQVNELARQAGQALPYDLAFLDPVRAEAGHARPR